VAADAAMNAPGTAPMLARIDVNWAKYVYLHAERANV
jgi:hypothetical protein